MSQDLEQGRTPASWRDDRPVAVVAAALAAACWVVATQLVGVDLEVRSGGGTQQVNVVSVVVTALVVAVAGAGLLRVLERRAPRALRRWTVVACVVWVVSLAGPASAATVGAGVVLALLHLVVAGVVVLGLRRTHRGRVA